MEMRPANVVMRLARMGSFHASRLSFMRQLLRRIKAEEWRVTRGLWEVDAQGVGVAVYTAQGPERAYSLVAFAHDLPPEMRSDRVIATAWDATFTLFDGVPTRADIERLRDNVPKQEAGRVSARELSLSRANRSVRLWDHVVTRLSQGQQPDAEMVDNVGYLMRTTAVYGSAKFGASDRAAIADRPECTPPFQVEMLSVWLTRTFVRDLVEHMAAMRGGGAAVRLAPEIARSLGIGNSTGLGMAPFLVNHPELLHQWINAREVALARVRANPDLSAWDAVRADLAARGQAVGGSSHPIQAVKDAELAADVGRLVARMVERVPYDALYRWAEAHVGLEAQEALVSALIEPHGALVDDLGAGMACDAPDVARLDGAMTVAALRDVLRQVYGWALEVDWADPAATAQVWYVSEEKKEPRLGARHGEEALDAYEQALQPGRDAAALMAALDGFAPDARVAEVALALPEHRHILRRAQRVARCPYGEIWDNTIGADVLPIDMLRCKLSFFGAELFDPRSDRWVRISMYRGAPYPEEMADGIDVARWTSA